MDSIYFVSGSNVFLHKSLDNVNYLFLLEKFGSGQSIETIVQLAADSSDIKFIERSELNIDFES